MERGRLLRAPFVSRAVCCARHPDEFAVLLGRRNVAVGCACHPDEFAVALLVQALIIIILMLAWSMTRMADLICVLTRRGDAEKKTSTCRRDALVMQASRYLLLRVTP